MCELYLRQHDLVAAAAAATAGRPWRWCWRWVVVQEVVLGGGGGGGGAGEAGGGDGGGGAARAVAQTPLSLLLFTRSAHEPKWRRPARLWAMVAGLKPKATHP